MLSNIPNELINNDSRDCPICYEETDGLKMTYHQYMKYYMIWFNTGKSPLIKCIKCNNYMCDGCIFNCKVCPFNCHNLDGPKTSLTYQDIYKQFAIFKDKEYGMQSNTLLWLFQTIYDYHIDPSTEILRPYNEDELQISIIETQNQFNNIAFNIEDQTITGFIKLPHMETLMKISYHVGLLIKDDYSNEIGYAQNIYSNMISQFKKDVLRFYEQIMEPLKDAYVEQDVQSLKYNKPEIDIDMEMSVAQLGFTSYIERVLKFCLLPQCGISYKYIDTLETIYISIFISLERYLYAEYVIWSILDDEEKEENEDNVRKATKEEFMDFFKGCGPQE